MRGRSSVAVVLGLVGMLACMPLPTNNSRGSGGGGGTSSPPRQRGEVCMGQGLRCDTGLTCVEFDHLGGISATCEIPCGGGCPDGMTCGTRHDIITGDQAANVCL